jgi:hypothetical protein
MSNVISAALGFHGVGFGRRLFAVELQDDRRQGDISKR